MNDVMSLAERADALERKMIHELDRMIYVKSRLFNLADGDLSTPNAAALLAANPGKTPRRGSTNTSNCRMG